MINVSEKVLKFYFFVFNFLLHASFFSSAWRDIFFYCGWSEGLETEVEGGNDADLLEELIG